MHPARTGLNLGSAANRESRDFSDALSSHCVGRYCPFPGSSVPEVVKIAMQPWASFPPLLEQILDKAAFVGLTAA
jgi:hypothetical protein